jgi:hypothetical protein
MTHEFISSYALDRTALSQPTDPDALGRAVDRVGSDFPAVGAVLQAWLVSS